MLITVAILLLVLFVVVEGEKEEGLRLIEAGKEKDDIIGLEPFDCGEESAEFPFKRGES